MHKLKFANKTLFIITGILFLVAVTACSDTNNTSDNQTSKVDGQQVEVKSMAIQFDKSSADWFGWVVTPDEKNKLNNSLNKKPNVEYLEDTDLVGGDLSLSLTKDAGECAALCARYENCTAFTFAKPDHPHHAKRHKCFLKKERKKARKDKYYTSGYLKD